MADDQVQHGIDDDPNNDAQKGATLGGLGGAAVGAAAGAMAGPVGAVVGAVVGGLSGAGASGLAVGAVDKVDNDNTVSGLGSSHGNAGGSTLSGSDVVGVTEPRRTDLADSGQNAVFGTTGTTVTHTSDVSDMNIDRGIADVPNVRSTGPSLDAGALASGSATNPVNMGAVSYGTTNPDVGVQTGGMTTAGADTRGITEKTADALTGDRTDDKTGGMVTQSGTSQAMGTMGNTAHNAANTVSDTTDNVGGHNIVTGGEAHTDAGKAGLGTGAVVGGLLGTAVGGPVGAVVGGALGSLTGGAAGDAAEAADEADDMGASGTNAGRRGI